MRLWLVTGFASLGLLSGCGAVSQSQTPTITETYDAKRAADTPVGVSKYASSGNPAYLCPRPDKLSGCRFLKSGKITVTAPAGSGQLGEFWYAVSVDSGKETGFLDSLEWITLQTEDERKKAIAEAAACDRKGGVRVGMTKPQVLASCWGKPTRVNATTTGRGTREQWVYGLSSYLYFDENGLLSTIQH